ncbi:MAG: hypothetical protein CM15mP126_3850 [Gammaproteobacteria bacterium]|nr:MAG: hypothetical protein CM15mP126_3850 [Gammaproteobacteria bacterium]
MEFNVNKITNSLNGLLFKVGSFRRTHRWDTLLGRKLNGEFNLLF